MALSRRTGQRFQASIWPGFVDAMTGLLLVLMFVLTIFMVVQFVLSETITGQETELDVLSAEVSALALALGLEEQENDTLEQRLGGLQSTLENAQNRAQQQTALIDSLTAQRAAQDANLAVARTQISGFEAQVAALFADQATALGAISQLEGERDVLLSDQEALNLALVSARSEIDAGQEAARLAAARREALEAMIADLNQDLEKGAATRSALETSLSQEEAARLAEAAAAEALRAKLLNADSELTAMTLALDAQRKRAEETLTMLAAADAARADLDLKLAAALLTGQSVETDLAAVLLVLEGEQDKSVSLNKEIASVRAELAAAVLGLDQTTREVADLQFRLAGTQSELARSKAQAGQTADQLQSSLEILETQLAAALAAQLAAESNARIAEQTGDGLQSALKTVEEKLAVALAARQSAEQALAVLGQEEDSLQTQLAAVLAAKLTAEAQLMDQGEVEKQLAAALAAQKAAELDAGDQLSAVEQREALLATANLALASEEARSAESLRQVAVLNQQVGALRSQLSGLQAILDDAKIRDAAAQVQLQSLGSDLNIALARAAAEERKRRKLEEAARLQLEAEALDLKSKARELERFRSEFFGRLRDVLGTQDGVRIEGDRFVFSSEVLFEVGSASLSSAGKDEIDKVADILVRVAGDIPDGIDWILRVDGHTDDQAFYSEGKYADNWELSQGRALSVVRYLVDYLGIPPNRVAANGFGEFQPIDPANTPEARAKNRRIELKFTEK